MNSTLFDSILTHEQRESRSLSEERMDPKGWVVRYRAEDQTLFDLMFVADMIERPEYDAGHLFLGSIEKSGAYPCSCNLEATFGTPAYRIGDLMGERRMAFGSAYRFAVSRSGEENAVSLMRVMDNIFKTSAEYGFSGEKLRSVSELALPSLRVLSVFYGTENAKDPRSIIRKRMNKKGGQSSNED